MPFEFMWAKRQKPLLKVLSPMRTDESTHTLLEHDDFGVAQQKMKAIDERTLNEDGEG